MNLSKESHCFAECATENSIGLIMPQKPLDVLAQQMVACAACEVWDKQKLFDLHAVGLPLSRAYAEGVR